MFTKVDAKSAHATNLFSGGADSLGLLSQFRNENLWRSDSAATGGMLCLLGHHAYKYFSPFRAAYLFEIKSMAALTFFSPILVRDGALTLLKFFYDNPRPPNESVLLIINDKLKSLVPADWASNVLTYNFNSNNTFNYSRDKTKILFFNTHLGHKQCSREFISELHCKITDRVKNKNFEIYISSFLSENVENLSTRGALAKHHNELLLEIINNFQSMPIIKSPNEIESEDVSGFIFCDLNEFNFYYSDSYFYHSLLSRGAIDIASTPGPSAAVAEIELSPYHKVEFFELPKTNFALTASQEAQGLLNGFRESKILSEEAAAHKSEKICFANKICSPSFEDFAYETAKNAANNTR